MNHLRARWHYHLSLWGLLLAGLVLILSGAAGTAVYYHVRGGYHPGPMQPPLRITGSPRLPASYSLDRYVVRIHNQGLTNSCVGQTLSTLEEITWAERTPRGHPHYRFAPGFIYNQVNAGQDNGTTYDAAFAVLLAQGDARLKYWHAPDTAWWVQPTRSQQLAARPYRYARWNSISLADRTTIEYEIAHGRPLALALPIHETLYRHFYDASVVRADPGPLYFWHSITVIAYSPTGIEFLNSWGPGYGKNGRTWLSWHFLARSGGYLAIASPRPQIPRQKPFRKPIKPIHPIHRPPAPPKPPTPHKTKRKP